ncbi:hypothetical protein ACHFJ0_05105 [Paracoccus sp. NGMCC 1.201697]|uniref:Tail spike TSP1/Gp66 N-terminal domain-containing protein n=1 Tax=Paracoccus broussonetiae subsp. drimophilus TaxID=3373869 RepID=A0ABW7LIJ1_9RHOB
MAKSVEEVFRDFTRYTGDGRPNEPVGHPLPWGDPRSGTWDPPKYDIRDALGGVYLAAQLAEEYAASATGTPQFSTRALAQAATVPTFANTILVAGQSFRLDPTGTALSTNGGTVNWSPSGSITPFHWGAIPWINTDQSAAFNAMSDWLRTQYVTDLGAFISQIDLCGLSWRCDSWNLTNIRQPAFSFGNGTIVSYGTGRTVVDCAGTNHARILGELSIEAPSRTNAPRVGMCIGRALFSGNPTPIAPDWAGRVRIDGYYTKAAFVNLASEVSRMDLHLTNKARSLTAVCLAHVGHMGTLDEFIGGLTSEYVTLPTAADGAMSNILHEYRQLICKRAADYAIPLLGISRANPAVATFNPADLTAAGISPGDAVFFHDHTGMPEIKNRRLIALAVNNGAGSVTLGETGGGNVNSTGYTAYGSGGRMWTSTGPAALFGNIRGLRMSAGYMLTYGDDAVILDCSRGSNGDLEFDFQAEANVRNSIRFSVGSSAAIIQGCRINLTSANQEAGNSFCSTTTSGTLRIDNLDLIIHGYSGTPTSSIWAGLGVTTLNNARIRVPYVASVPWTGWASFSGTIEVAEVGISRTIRNGVAMASATAAQMQAIASQINTVGKFQGLPCLDTTNNRVLYASGSATTATWRDGAGTVVYTPS